MSITKRVIAVKLNGYWSWKIEYTYDGGTKYSNRSFPTRQDAEKAMVKK